jgi:serine phosphatase RsbU (regulator of sigma subunit)
MSSSVPPWADHDPPPTLLVVDDAHMARQILCRNLARHGYRFLTAANGQEAIACLRQHREVDLILLDLVMPEMDGFQFLRWRSHHPEAQDIPVIVNSSLDDFDSIVKALTMGTYDYFTKPLSPDDLETVLPLKIRNAVTTRRLMLQIRRQNQIMRRELEMAARYQQFLLPQRVEVAGAHIAFRFEPCSAVGGDYFDFLELEEGALALLVADVSGHGVAAAMTATMIKALLPRYLERRRSPAAALATLNRDLLGLTPEDVFVSAFAALYWPHQHRLVWCLAGHPPPLLFRAGEPVRRLETASVFLGVFSSDHPLVDYSDQELCLNRGDRLLLYTDGLTEAPGPGGEMFGLERLEELLARHGHLGLEDLRDRLWERLRHFVEGEFPDDVALILVDF